MKAIRVVAALVAIVLAAAVVYHFHMRRQAARLNNEAKVLLDQGRYADALVRLERVRRIEPDNHVVWRNLGVAYEGLNQNAKALEAFERSLRLNPAQPDVKEKVGSLRAMLKPKRGAGSTEKP